MKPSGNGAGRITPGRDKMFLHPGWSKKGVVKKRIAPGGTKKNRKTGWAKKDTRTGWAKMF